MAYTDPDGSRLKKQILVVRLYRDHGYETDRCRSLKFLVEKLIKVGHLKRYIREINNGVESR